MEIKIKKITDNEEKKFFSMFVSDSDQSVDELIENYGWIADYVVEKFSKLSTDIELIGNDAYDALIEAAAEYNCSDDESFSLYSIKKIREKVFNTVIDEGYLAHRNESITNMLIRAKNIENVLGNNINNDVTDWKVAQALNISETELNAIIYGKSKSVDTEQLKEMSKKSSEIIKNVKENSARNVLRYASSKLNKFIDEYKDS